MKGGHTPIHIQRWAPADYQSDEHVQLLLRRRSWGTLTFYRQFMDASFLAGGDLPADPEALSACVRMPVAEVAKALEFCLGRLLHRDGDRIYQKRVRRDVAKEMEVRAIQSELGREGGKVAGRGRPKVTPIDKDRVDPIGPIGPPSPSPSPTPSPSPDRTKDTPVKAGGLAPTRGTNGNGHPPASPPGGVLDHDPDNDGERLLAEACERLARLHAGFEGRDVTDDDRRHALEAATMTDREKAMDTIRGAPWAWIRTSLAIAERLERELAE